MYKLVVLLLCEHKTDDYNTSDKITIFASNPSNTQSRMQLYYSDYQDLSLFGCLFIENHRSILHF